MKLTWRQIEPFIRKPDPAARVILLYGPDGGLMQERSRLIGGSVVADLADPFNVAVFSGDSLLADPARLNDEAQAISMMGGNRLIRIESAGDKITPLLKDYLAAPSPHTLVLLEAGELTARSPLRALCEKSPHAAAIPCYVDDAQAVLRMVRETLQEAGLRINADAAGWAAEAIRGDRRKIRSELEKLVLYKGTDQSPVSLEDVQAVCGEAGSRSVDDLVHGAAGNRPAQAMAAYTLLCEEGVSFVVILRSLQNHFRRLHMTRARLEDGDALDSAMKKLSPPVFFKQEDSFRAQVGAWSSRAIEKVLNRLQDLEAECKRTGAPVETLCAQAVLGITMMRR